MQPLQQVQQSLVDSTEVKPVMTSDSVVGGDEEMMELSGIGDGDEHSDAYLSLQNDVASDGLATGPTDAAQKAVATKEKKKKKKTGKRYECEICKKTFTENCNLKKHLLTHSSRRPFGCDRCGARFTQNSHLKEHRIGCLARPHSCPKCRKRFVTKIQLEEHAILHEHQKENKEDHEKADGVYKCTHCPQTFQKFSNLERHLPCHSDDRPFKCDKCDKSFARKNELVKHVLLHADDRRFACPQCDHRAVSVGRLNDHLKQVHDQLVHFCTKCAVRFKTLAELKNHSRAHTRPPSADKSRPNSDDDVQVMEYSSIEEDEQSRHSIPPGGRPFECDECEKSFRDSFRLKEHKQSHTGERPFTCSLCVARFFSQRYLSDHLKRVHNQLIHVCTVCNARFRVRAELTEHKLNHEGTTALVEMKSKVSSNEVDERSEINNSPDSNSTPLVCRTDVPSFVPPVTFSTTHQSTVSYRPVVRVLYDSRNPSLYDLKLL